MGIARTKGGIQKGVGIVRGLADVMQIDKLHKIKMAWV